MQLIRPGSSPLYSLVQYYKTYASHISYYSFCYYVISLSHFKVLCSHFFITSHILLAPFMLQPQSLYGSYLRALRNSKHVHIQDTVLQMTSLTIGLELRFFLLCFQYCTSSNFVFSYTELTAGVR